MLYAKHDVNEEAAKVQTLGHYFNPQDSLADKLGVAGSNYELTQSVPVIAEYLSEELTWREIAKHEEKMARILLDFLGGREDVIVFGEKTPDSGTRVPTISFVVKGKGSKEVVEEVERNSDFGIRYGHFYSKRLVEEVLGAGKEGVVRVSLVHYNTGESKCCAEDPIITYDR